jgi:hypothetical protein
MSPNDVLKPAAGVLGYAAVAALGFAAGYMVARDPELLRRFARTVAGGVERLSVAVATSREELADMWVEMREQAQNAAETADVSEAVVAAAATEAPKRARKTAAKRAQKQPRAAAKPRAAKRVVRKASKTRQA